MRRPSESNLNSVLRLLDTGVSIFAKGENGGEVVARQEVQQDLPLGDTEEPDDLTAYLEVHIPIIIRKPDYDEVASGTRDLHIRNPEKERGHTDVRTYERL